MDNVVETITRIAGQSLSIQTQIDFKPQKLPSSKLEINSDLSSVLKATSNNLTLFISIFFEKKHFFSILSSMLGKEIKSDDNSYDNTASELLTIIFGTSKTELKSLGHNFEQKKLGIIKNINLNKSIPKEVKFSTTKFISEKGSLIFAVFLKD